MAKYIRQVVVFLGTKMSITASLDETNKPIRIEQRSTRKVLSELGLYENALVDKKTGAYKVYCAYGDKPNRSCRYYISEDSKFAYFYCVAFGQSMIWVSEFNGIRFGMKDNVGYCSYKYREPYICCNNATDQHIIRQMFQTGKSLIWFSSELVPSLFAGITPDMFGGNAELYKRECEHAHKVAPKRLKVLAEYHSTDWYYVALMSNSYLDILSKRVGIPYAELRKSTHKGTLLKLIEEDYTNWSSNDKITAYADMMAEFLYV